MAGRKALDLTYRPTRSMTDVEWTRHVRDTEFPMKLQYHYPVHLRWSGRQNSQLGMPRPVFDKGLT